MAKAAACLTTNLAITVSDLAVEAGEPRVHDLRLADVLGFGKRHDIRTLIRRHSETLSSFGDLVARQDEKLPQGGRPGRSYHLNKRQALFITAKSDTERAALVTVQMVEVFDAVTGGASVPVRGHRRRLPRPEMKDGRGCIVLAGKPTFFDVGRRPAPGDLAVVVFGDGHVGVLPVPEQYADPYRAPEPGFVMVESPSGGPRGAKNIRERVALIGAVTTSAGTPKRIAA